MTTVTHRRADVQGLRGIAVLLVIGVHSVGVPRGGSAGVDMFFVISGFVITAGLLREADRSGTVSLKSFYLRRLRRIAPAALVTVTVTAAAAAVLLPAAVAASVGTDAVWAGFGAENVRMALSRLADPVPFRGAWSPVGHLWSLGVEEQFYLVWPLLLLVAWRVGVRYGHPRRWLAGGAAGASAVSFAAAVSGSLVDPSGTYYSTAARGWELGVGCVLAVAAPRLAGIGRRVALLCGFGGVAAVAAGCVVWGQDGFPLPAALLPVAGTAALIAAGSSSGDLAVTALLQRRGLVRVGELSYSLYLWHFPVFVFLAGLAGAGPLLLVIGLAVTAGLAWLSFRFVEQPVLRLASRESSPTRSRTTVSPASPPTPSPSTP